MGCVAATVRGAASVSANAVVGFGANASTYEPSDRGADAVGRQFLEFAVAEVPVQLAIAQLAAERAQSDVVRRFARMFCQRHSALADEAGSAARSRKVLIQFDATGARIYRDLSSVSDARFDACFVDAMITALMHDIEAFYTAATSANDDFTRQFAAGHLSVLRAQLRAATALRAGLSR